MVVTSYVRQGLGLRPIEIEVSLVRGLPQMKFLGQATPLIRESEHRIRAAIKAQGFQFPRAQQILVQMRPADLPKKSRGLDLAVAAAFLWASEQAPRPDASAIGVYGELDLSGSVLVPTDVEDLELQEGVDALVTGPAPLARPHFQMKTLQDLHNLEWCEGGERLVPLQRPEVPVSHLTAPQADLVRVVAAGEHPCLLAGPPGSGKSLLARVGWASLAEPSRLLQLEFEQIARSMGESLGWRPRREPHHTITDIALVGGGAQATPGEITRAHGGALILDEFLEFSPAALEALREPLESGRLHVVRASGAFQYPAEFVLIATTNLCRCGEITTHSDHRCRCKLNQRRAYFQKLSGPMLDRFHVVGLTESWKGHPTVSTEEVRAQVIRAREFARTVRGQKEPNSRSKDLLGQLKQNPQVKREIDAFTGNYRTLDTLAKVARTVADLEASEDVFLRHWAQALEFCVKPKHRLTHGLGRFL